MNAKRTGFQWNAGGWFGASLGVTCWLLICALLLISESPRIAGLVLACFLVANAASIGFWAARSRIAAYPAFQILLAIVWVCSLVSVYLIDHAGLWHAVSGVEIGDIGGTVSATSMKWFVWLMFPLTMLWFHALQRQTKT